MEELISSYLFGVSVHLMFISATDLFIQIKFVGGFDCDDLAGDIGFTLEKLNKIRGYSYEAAA